MISKLLVEFKDYLENERRLSEHTVLAYCGDLRDFFDFAEQSFEIKEIDEVTSGIVRTWIMQLMDSGIDPRSVHRKISSLRAFWRRMLKMGIAKNDPLNKIVLPKTSKKLPVFIDEDKMESLLDKVEFGEDFVGLRNRLIIEMFYSTGMRLAEMVNLKIENVDFYNNTLKVLGKRNKERIIPFNNELAESAKSYMNESVLRFGMQSNFFLTDSGQKIYPKLIYRTVNAYLSLISTQKKKSPHVLRHTFATHMLDKGADINAIKELLGHANLSATQIYTHNSLEKLKNVYKQAHPRA